jgi:hypothetical protein
MNVLSQRRSRDFAACLGCETLLISGNSAEFTGSSAAHLLRQTAFAFVGASPIMHSTSPTSETRYAVIPNLTVSQGSKHASGPTRRASVVRKVASPLEAFTSARSVSTAARIVVDEEAATGSSPGASISPERIPKWGCHASSASRGDVRPGGCGVCRPHASRDRRGP